MIGMVSPKILLAAPPQYSKTFATMSISARAEEMGEVLLTLPDQERRPHEEPAALPRAHARPRALFEGR